MTKKRSILETDYQAKVVKRIKKEFPEMFFWKASDKLLAGIPDLVGCYKGQMWAIELKVDDNEPTLLQEVTLEKMKKAGAIVTWNSNIHGIDAIVEFLKGVVTIIDKGGE